MLQNYLLALTSLATVMAASCNPLKQSGCPADTALGSSFKEDFSSESKYFDVVNSKGLSYTDKGLSLTLSERFDNPSIKSNFYIMFGKVEVVLQAAAGQGIISSFYLQSDDLDEIDIELTGTDDTQFQSNYFSKGDTTNYDRGQFHNTPSNPLANFLTYTIDWTEESLTWSLNGEVVRTLLPNNPEGYPQSPMYIMAGIWAGGDPSNAPGTIEWAGGLTDYSKAPFSMHIQSLVVTDYSSGLKYTYGDQSGSYTSIKSEGGSINGRVQQAQNEFAKLVDGQSIPDAIVPSAKSVAASSTSPATSTSPSTTTSDDFASVSTSTDAAISTSSNAVVSSADLATSTDVSTSTSATGAFFTSGSTTSPATTTASESETDLIESSTSATVSSPFETSNESTFVTSTPFSTTEDDSFTETATQIPVSDSTGTLEQQTLTLSGGSTTLISLPTTTFAPTIPTTLVTISSKQGSTETSTSTSQSSESHPVVVTSHNGSSTFKASSLSLVFALCGYFII